MDYNIVDPIVAPAGHEAFYREKLVHLPHGYQPNDNRQVIADRILTRADCGLPEDGVVFASFNQSFKFDPLMFATWMRLLAAVPGSVLWLLTYEGTSEACLRRVAAEQGIDPQRLIFAPKVPKAEHLRRIQLADLCLDTRIYTGHTTTSDVLWAGVPVVALRGRHFASLVSASGLTNMGMSDLVTESLEGYETLALRLAQDAGARDALRARIAANRRVFPLFDTPRFVRNLERAYLRMWDIYCAGEPPQAITITDPN
jgi:predicted O-linked N-acetylglucosamine transferase (SPINDLY family)